MENLQDALLRDALNRLSDSVGKLYEGQAEMRDRLNQSVDGLRKDQQETREQIHAAVTDNTVKVSALDARMTGMENSVRHFKADVRKEARRWGAIGGACSTAVAIVVALLKAVFTGFPKLH